MWKGTHLWTWKATESMIAQAKSMGATGILIKFANGSLNNDAVSQGYMNNFKQLAPLAKAAGLRVGGWIYQYLTDVQGEVDACSQAIDAGAEWIVLDGEVEIQSKNSQVKQFGMLFRQKYPDYILGLSSFAISDYHQEVPFLEYSQFVNVMMPQVYWADMGWPMEVTFRSSIASYQKYGKPIAPTGQSYNNASSADMTKFVELCKSYSHVSWWDIDEATQEQLTTIQSNVIPSPQPVNKLDPIGAKKVEDVLGSLYNASSDPDVQASAHYAANALRIATGGVAVD